MMFEKLCLKINSCCHAFGYKFSEMKFPVENFEIPVFF